MQRSCLHLQSTQSRRRLRTRGLCLANMATRRMARSFTTRGPVMIATSVRMGALFLCLTLSFDAFAFAGTGHTTVGTIADRLLDGTNAGKQARKILGSNLRTASVWADCA